VHRHRVAFWLNDDAFHSTELAAEIPRNILDEGFKTSEGLRMHRTLPGALQLETMVGRVADVVHADETANHL